jgi:signal transduction histidine kinase
MIELVDDMLRFSQTNSRELDRRSVSLHALTMEVIEEQVPPERRAQVHVLASPGTTLLADAPLLKVVLHNLLSNAVKFTRTSASPNIEVDLLSEAERDVLVVRDNGVGFDPQHKEQVFGAFKRLHKTDQFEGTGIGLAIVSRIVRKHGGTAWAESEPSKGTTMYIAFPRATTMRTDLPFGQVA